MLLNHENRIRLYHFTRSGQDTQTIRQLETINTALELMQNINGHLIPEVITTIEESCDLRRMILAYKTGAQQFKDCIDYMRTVIR